jgi:hypothetical protein
MSPSQQIVQNVFRSSRSSIRRYLLEAAGVAARSACRHEAGLVDSKSCGRDKGRAKGTATATAPIHLLELARRESW